MARAAIFVVLFVCALLGAHAIAGCTPVRGSACTGTTSCGSAYVCASTSSPGLRRCLLPCAADSQASCGTPVTTGMLCADGSVCLESDMGPVCYFAGRIALGDPCPSPDCDPATTVCDCEPGTICHTGVCRQVCNAHPRCPDAPGVEDAGPPVTFCGEGLSCTGGVCL